MNSNNSHHRAILQNLAHHAMLERGLLPDFSKEALAELDRIQSPVMQAGAPESAQHQVRDLRHLLWASIDNDDSRDLDQLTFAQGVPADKGMPADKGVPAGKVKILVAIADVDSIVKNGSAIDDHARHNTTSVYTAAEIFPMLPERISTDVTSLNFEEDRLAVVVEMGIGADGALEDSSIYRAWVRNHARLAYNNLAAWLEGHGDIPGEVSSDRRP